MKTERYPENDPRHHAVNIQRMLEEVMKHCREDAEKIHEPKAQALCETTAEVLQGLKTAWNHYETRAEPAMTPQR
jgi:hypothetical protein